MPHDCGEDRSVVCSPSLRVTVNIKKIIRLLVVIVAALAVLYIITNLIRFYFDHDYIFGLAPLFDLNREANIPSLFSSWLLLLASVLLAVITYLKRRYRQTYVLHWGVLSVIFLYLSIDEACSLHENLNCPFRVALNTSGCLYFAWVIPYVILVIIFVIAYSRFLFHLKPRFRLLFILSGFIYVSGAVGVELVGAHYMDQVGSSRESLFYTVAVFFEEMLEMGGVVFFIYSLLHYLHQNYGSFDVSVSFFKQ